jgi:hypothetical protein
VRAAVDDAHLTAQHIEELRQIINAGVAEIRTYLGHLGGSVPPEFDIFYCMQRGAKTQRVKTSAANPDALPALKDGAWTLELDCDGDDGHQGKSENDQRTSGYKISEASYPSPEPWPLKPNKNHGLLDSGPLRLR